MIRDGPNIEYVEGHVGAPGLDMYHTAFPEGMPNAEFVKNIGIVNTHIHEAQVGEQKFLKHVREDIAAGLLFIGAEGFKACALKGRLDKLSIYRIEVVDRSIAAFFLSKRHDHKSMWAMLRAKRSGLFLGIVRQGQRFHFGRFFRFRRRGFRRLSRQYYWCHLWSARQRQRCWCRRHGWLHSGRFRLGGRLCFGWLHGLLCFLLFEESEKTHFILLHRSTSGSVSESR
jgi:hypothetical protein